jgi:3-hydroxyacyl-CoA dehydrogenase
VLKKGIAIMKRRAYPCWVNDMLASESKSYTIKKSTISTISQLKHRQNSWTRFIHYSKQHSRKQKCGVIAVLLSQTWRWDLELRFQSKMNTIGGDVLQAINKAIE